MSIAALLIVLLVLIAAFYLVATYVPEPARIVLLIILGVVTVFWALKVSGIWGSMAQIHT